MTVSTTTTRIAYTADGTQDEFDVTFKVYDTSHLEVYVDGVLQAEDTHYTVSLSEETYTGSITFESDYIPEADAQVLLIRVPPLTQLIDYEENDSFPSEAHEQGLDLATMRDQYLKEIIDRCIKLTVSSTYTDLAVPDPVDGRFLRWKEDSSGLENINIEDLSGYEAISDFVKTLLDDENASAFLATLGITDFAKTILDDTSALVARTTLKMENIVFIADCSDDLGAAIAAIGSDLKTVVVSKEITLTGNVTIPTTTTLMILQGGKINLGGYDLTVTGHFDAGSYEVFTGSGTVVFTENTIAYPEWWGIDGTADDVQIKAAAAALSAGGGVELTGNYSVDSDLTIATENVEIFSKSWSVITASTNEIRGIRFDADNCRVRGIVYVGTGKNTTHGYGAIHLTNGYKYCSAIDNVILTASGCGIVDDGDYNTVIGNHIIETGEHGIYLSSPNYSVHQGNIIVDAGKDGSITGRGIKIDGAVNCAVFGNTILNSNNHGMELVGTASRNAVTGNTIKSPGEDGISLSGGASIHNAVTGNNIQIDVTGRYGIGLTGSTTSNNIDGNIITVEHAGAGGISCASTFNRICNNEIVANGVTTTTQAIVLTADDNQVSGNKIYGSNAGSWAQGIAGSSVSDRNQITDNNIDPATVTTRYNISGRDNILIDPQYVASVQTTDAIATAIYQQALTDDTAYLFTFEIVGIKSDFTDRGSYIVSALAYNDPVTVQGTTFLSTIESDPAWNVGVNAVSSYVRVQVVGVADTTINWKLKVRFIKV